jgi:hypothetical protein
MWDFDNSTNVDLNAFRGHIPEAIKKSKAPEN